MSSTYQGSCLCGQIRFEVTGFHQPTAHCHCSMCRKFHGAPFAALTQVDNLTWLSGKHLLKDYVAPNGTTRTFCEQCGSSVGFRRKGDDLAQIELSLALFDSDIEVEVDAHIYTDYQSNWYPISDDLPQFKEGRE